MKGGEGVVLKGIIRNIIVPVTIDSLFKFFSIAAGFVAKIICSKKSIEIRKLENFIFLIFSFFLLVMSFRSALNNNL
jgi:hypothetical protein